MTETSAAGGPGARDLVAELDNALGSSEYPLGVSMATSPELLLALRTRDLDLRPVVRGRTVWREEYGGTVLVQSPNHLGRFEERPRAKRLVLVSEGNTDDPAWSADRVVRISSGEGTSGSHAERTAAAQKLAKSFAQQPRVRLAHGLPETPVFVVLVPSVQESDLGETIARGPLSQSPLLLPGLPGGVRISVGGMPTTEETEEFVRAVAGTRIASKERIAR